MAADRRERAMENLAVASAIGFMAIVVAAASLFSDSAASAAERAALADVAGAEARGESARFDDPAFSRIHSLSGGSSPYGAVLSLPTRQGALRAALLFRRDGTVSSARVLGPDPAPAWLKLIPGTKAGAPAPSRRLDAADPDAVSGATESYIAWAEAAGRAAAAAASLAGASK